MAHAAAQHEQVPYGMIERKSFPDIENNTKSVEKATGHKPGNASSRDDIKEWLDGDDYEPPHPDIDEACQYPGSPYPEDGHEHPESCKTPYKTKKSPPPWSPQFDQGKRCVGAGDKQIDGGMIQVP